jgi:hypothetical protein
MACSGIRSKFVQQKKEYIRAKQVFSGQVTFQKAKVLSIQWTLKINLETLHSFTGPLELDSFHQGRDLELSFLMPDFGFCFNPDSHLLKLSTSFLFVGSPLIG